MCFVVNIHFITHIQYILTWLFIFIPLKGICFATTSIVHVLCLKKFLSIITFSTVNIIPSALKLTPATRSMINKAQYCQRSWQCKIILSTHSHGACNLVLVLKISLQVWGRDWRNEHGGESFVIFLSVVYTVLVSPLWKIKDIRVVWGGGAGQK